MNLGCTTTELKITRTEKVMTVDSSDIIDFVASGDITRFKECFVSMVSERIVDKIQDRRVEIMCSMHEEEESGDADAEAGPQIDGGEDDSILADPSMSKEFFVKRVDYGGHEIVLKKLGLGATKPIVVHVDGKRWELFPGPKMAEKEAKKYIESLNKKQPSESEKA